MIDWNAIRMDYVCGNASQRMLATKYNLSLSQIGERAAKEGWLQSRREHNEQVMAHVQQMNAEQKAEVLAAQLIDVAVASENLAALIAEISAESQHLMIGRTKKADTKAIRNLTGALKDLVDVIRNVYELPTLQEKQKQDHAGGATDVRVIFDEDEEEE